MKKPAQKKLPARQRNAKSAPTTPLGIAIYQARVQKNITQGEIGKALAKKLGGGVNNARLGAIELGRKKASDEELAVIASVLQLSLPTLRAKRDESEKDRIAIGKRRYREKLAPQRTERKAAHQLRAPEPAGAPALADFIELIDGVIPMPTDKEARKRWLASVVELHKIGGHG